MEQLIIENIGKISPSHLLILLCGYAVAKLARKVESDEKDKFIGILREQIKEMKDEITELKKEIDDLSDEIGVERPKRKPRSKGPRKLD